MDLTFEGKAIRVVGSAEAPMWVARDVAEVLGIDRTTLSRRLEGMPDEWKGMYLIHTLGGKQEMAVVREPGLYALIFRSEKPEAQRFQRWVFEVVLPEIRRTGGFSQTGDLAVSFDLLESYTEMTLKLVRGLQTLMEEGYGPHVWRSAMGILDVVENHVDSMTRWVATARKRAEERVR